MPSKAGKGEHRAGRPIHVQAIFFLAEWAMLFGLWLLFVSTTDRAEIYLGLGTAFIAAGAAAVVEAANFARFAPHLGELVQAWRLPWYLLSGTWEIFLVLAQQALGKPAQSLVRSVTFHAGGDDAHSSARRALAVALTTIPPNFVVIGIDRKKRQLIFHQVKRSSVPLMTQNLGARP